MQVILALTFKLFIDSYFMFKEFYKREKNKNKQFSLVVEH